MHKQQGAPSTSESGAMPAPRRRWVRPVLFIAWIVFFTLPIGFFFTAARPRLDWDGLGLYATVVELFGAQVAGWVFCGLWLALNAAMLRQVWKRRDFGPSLDLDDYG
jgi:hypothetical protein